jgi:hypothetical protein
VGSRPPRGARVSGQAVAELGQAGGGTPTCPCTTASRNAEHNVYLPPYARRRQQEQADLSRKPSLGEWVGGLVRGVIDRLRAG